MADRLTVDGTLAFSFLTRAGGERIHYLRPSQPLRDGGWPFHMAPAPGLHPPTPTPLGLHGDLLCDSVTGAEVGGLPPAIPLGGSPVPLPPGWAGIDPRVPGSQGGVSRSTSLAPTIVLPLQGRALVN